MLESFSKEVGLGEWGFILIFDIAQSSVSVIFKRQGACIALCKVKGEL
jgi:hypothetical protein